MRKLEVLAYAGRKSRSGKNTLIADIVDIGGKEHLIIDLYSKRELIYRMATIWNMLIMIIRVKNGMQ